MPHRMQALVLVLFCLLLAACETSLATTNCEQSFTFLGKSPGAGKSNCGSTVFWIAEDVSGECQTTHLIQIVISETEAFVATSDVKKYEDWAWMKEGIEHLSTETPIELERHGRLWYFQRASWTIRAPVTSYDYKTEWKKEFKQYSSCEDQWNEDYGSETVLSPGFAGIKGELVYFYPEGLYIEYEITKAYYFARSGYILVFTQQPVLASGDDTMHGFLLFREDVGFSKLSDSEWASGALRVFFSLLHAGRYGEASRYCGKGCYTWLRESNPAVAANDFPALLMYGCTTNGLQCLEINRIVRVQEISPTIFKVTVEFKDDEGTIFAIKAEAQPPSSRSFTISEFSYTLKKVGDRFLVEGLPPYIQ